MNPSDPSPIDGAVRATYLKVMFKKLLAHRWIKPLIPRRFRSACPLVPVVRLTGAIAAEGPLPIAKAHLSLSAIGNTLERAFSIKNAAAIALVINSPGGSAVQSHLIFKRIRALAEENSKTVIAFVEDAAASGGYMIACAADDIYADPSSIIGSIGVISAGFGFPAALAKLGIERRVFTAGTHKAMLDPFSPLDPDDVERLKALQIDVHDSFAGLVRERRGAKLAEEGRNLFTGEFWSGRQAVALGLIDGLGDIRSILRERFGEKVDIKLISGGASLFSRKPLAISSAFHDEFAEKLVHATGRELEARALWARFGL